MFLDWVQEKVLPAVLKVTNSKALTAVKDGVVATLPLTVVGSIFLLVAAFPIPAFVDWLKATGIRPILMQAFGATFNLLALVIAFSIAYYYSKNDGVDGLSSGIISMITFVMLINHSVTNSDKVTIGGAIPTEWLGAKGMIGAILVAIFSAIVFDWFVKRKITIKMPDSVPEGVSNSFISVVPAAVIFSSAALVYGFFNLVMKTTFLESIYKTIQTPLQHLTSTFWGACGAAILVSLLWWFGIHGAILVSSVIKPILLSNAMENQKLIDAGVALTAENGFIFTENFRTSIMILTGSGITIGIVLFMMFFAKSEQLKQLGKISFVPAIFNINEPITFGTPIVLNPILFIPYVVTPLVATATAYMLMNMGLIPIFGSIMPPFTTPAIMSGLLISGWQLALYQVFIVFLSFIIYFPFMKKQDEIMYKQEQGEA